MKVGECNVHIAGNALEIELQPVEGSRGSDKKQIDEWLKKGRGGYDLEELREAFRTVADAGHWKEDINAVVPVGMKDILTFAIPWHTGGGEVRFEDFGDGTMRVTAPGYWSNGMEG